MARARIIYSDPDRQRLSAVTRILTTAGYAVWPCSGEAPVSSPVSFGTPDLVLLSPGLDESLHELAAALWPDVPTLVLSASEDYRQLPLRIESALRKPAAE